MPGFVPIDSIPRDTLGMGHTTPIATSVRKTWQISMLCADVWMTLMYLLAPYQIFKFATQDYTKSEGLQKQQV